jgi:hypothetical protein
MMALVCDGRARNFADVSSAAMTKQRQRERARRRLQQQRAQQRTEQVVFYHGGIPGLRDFILPASQADPFMAAKMNAQELEIYNADLVSVTTSLDWALYFAACHRSGCGSVYEVEPVDGIERDPDLPSVWFRCSKARIIRRVHIPIGDFQAQRQRILAGSRYIAFFKSSRWYTKPC